MPKICAWAEFRGFLNWFCEPAMGLVAAAPEPVPVLEAVPPNFWLCPKPALLLEPDCETGPLGPGVTCLPSLDENNCFLWPPLRPLVLPSAELLADAWYV